VVVAGGVVVAAGGVPGSGVAVADDGAASGGVSSGLQPPTQAREKVNPVRSDHVLMWNFTVLLLLRYSAAGRRPTDLEIRMSMRSGPVRASRNTGDAPAHDAVVRGIIDVPATPSQ
jgi:hypothetical protein